MQKFIKTKTYQALETAEQEDGTYSSTIVER